MKKFRVLLALLICIIGSLSAQQLYFQGFEPGDNWDIITGTSQISNDNGATYFPANQTIRSGAHFWKVNNSTNTLILDSKSVLGQNNVKVIVRLASISVTSANGSETTDSVQIFAILNGVTPTQADITVTGATNSRWGYNANLTGSTNAGTPTTFVSPQNGFSTNNYATLVINIPNGTSTVGLMVRGKNNSTNEIWAIDDIEMIACPSVVLSGPTSGCLGDTLTFTSTHLGHWSMINTNGSIISNPSNTNTVQIVLNNGSSTGIAQTVNSCEFTRNINIFTKPLPPILGPVNPICQGKSAVLSANSSNNTVHWFDSPTGSSIATGNVFTTPPLTQTGTVTYYTASENLNGCFSQRIPVEITVNPSPTKFSLSGASVCSSNNAIITLGSSENGIEYELIVDNSPTGQVYIGNGSPLNFIITNPTQGSTVFIEAIDPNFGCITYTDTLTITIANSPNDFYTFNVDTLSICEDNLANFSTSGSQPGIVYYVYINGNPTSTTRLGNGQGMNFSISGLQDGDIIYLLAVDTVSGCSIELVDQIYVQVFPKPEITISENSGIFTADSTIGTFAWYYNGNLIIGQNQYTLNIQQTGTGSGDYFLIYTNQQGCIDTSNVINLTVSEITVNWQQSLLIYPNPFKEFIVIETPVAITLNVRNLLGQVLYSKPISNGKNHISLEFLVPGVYLLEFEKNDERVVQKLIKQQ